MRLGSRLRPLCTVVRHRSLCDNNILRQPTAVAVVALYTSCRCWRHAPYTKPTCSIQFRLVLKFLSAKSLAHRNLMTLQSADI